MGKNQPVCFFSKGVKLLFCFKNMSQNSCFVCQGMKRIEEREELICVVMVCFKSCTILMFKIRMRELCCVKFCMLSPMDGYYAPGTPLRVHRVVIHERYLGMCPGVHQVIYI